MNGGGGEKNTFLLRFVITIVLGTAADYSLECFIKIKCARKVINV